MATHESLMLDLPAGPCDAVVARPSESAGAPPVILLMDAVGLRPRIVEMAEQVAGLGYTVLAANLFYRAGHQPLVDDALLVDERRDERVARFHELFASLTNDDWDADGPVLISEARRLAGSDEGVRVLGYCMGGRLGIRLAARNPDDIACVAAFHPGQLVTEAPDSPHVLLAELRCPLVLGHADEDASMPPEHQGVLARRAGELHLDYTGALMPGARHGYTMADLPAYDAAADARHRAMVTGLFARV